MRTLILLAAALAIGGAYGCEEKRTTTDVPKHTKVAQTVEYQLAIQNAGGLLPENHPSIEQFKPLVASLDAKYPEDPQKIADLSIEARRTLQAAGLTDTLLSLMQQVDKAGGSYPDYNSAVKAYVAKRKSGGR